MPSASGRRGVEQDEPGPLRSHQLGQLSRVVRRQRRVARRRQGVAHVAAGLGVVVDHQDGRLVSLVPGSVRRFPRGAGGVAAGFVGCRRRGGDPGEQVGDEAAQVVGLLVDGAEELQHLGRVEGGRGAQHGGRRALDGNEGGAQLVTHRAQELGPQPLELLEGFEVLQGDDHRVDLAAVAADGHGVDQGPHLAAVGNREHDLLGAQRRGARRRRQRQPGEGELAPVGEPARHRLDHAPGGPAGPQGFDHARRLAVERHGTAGAGVEHHHAHRRGLDEGLEVGPGAGDALPERLVLPPQVVVTLQGSTSSPGAARFYPVFAGSSLGPATIRRRAHGGPAQPRGRGGGGGGQAGGGAAHREAGVRVPGADACSARPSFLRGRAPAPVLRAMALSDTLRA